ncbi:MAG: cytochrome P450 [Novosphingobium sp.]
MAEAMLAPDIDDMFDIEEDARRNGSGVIDDPYPLWAEMLRQAPVHEGPLAGLMGRPLDAGVMYHPGPKYFSVMSFQGVSEVFTRKDDFDSGFYRDTGTFTDAILGMDGLKHRRFRDVIQVWFQPDKASSWWRDKVIAPLVDELVGAFDAAPGVDLNAQLFARLPMRTATEGFGLTPEEGLDFRRFLLGAMSSEATPQQKGAAMQAANAILDRVIRERQAAPQDDIISRLVETEFEDEDGTRRKLTIDEVASYCRLIVFAGGGTTWKQLGITAFALLNNPDQLEAVRADRSLLPKAILESARWYPNDPMFPRQAKRNTVLEGVEIPAGSVMHLCLGSANRDPSRWERPDLFDIFRPVQRSVAFAAGAHSCLGQHVAREEMLGALNALLDRFPNIRWDPAYPPARLSGSLLSRGPGPLHVLLR